jgi:ATP-binding cassette subfamily B protein
VSYNIAHLMHFIPVSIQAAAAVRHIRNCSTTDPRRRPCGCARPPRITNDITFDRVTFGYDGNETPVLDNLSLKLNVGKISPLSAPAAPARARC